MFELLLITDARAPEHIPGRVEAALHGKVSDRIAVQLRAKHLTAVELRPLARDLRAITRRAGAKLLLNGPLELAEDVDADGVHLPEAGPGPREALAAIGGKRIIGVSCHGPEGLARAARAGADYATLSPVFDSPGKGQPLGLDRFGEWARAAPLPVFALGGVTPRSVRELRSVGAAGVAVISAVFGTPSPSQATDEFLRELEKLNGR